MGEVIPDCAHGGKSGAANISASLAFESVCSRVTVKQKAGLRGSLFVAEPSMSAARLSEWTGAEIIDFGKLGERRVTGNQLARSPKSGLLKGITRLFGPLGVFVRGAIEHPKMVGAIFPSSPGTVRAMLQRIDWANTKLFVEYGPGVGTFTLPVLDRLPKGAQLLAIDTNPLFVEHLNSNIDDPRFRAVLGSAADVEKLVRAHGFEHADYILSGIPFSTLPEGLPDQIAAASYRALRPGGAFMTYQYRKNAGDLTERHFDRTDRETAWVNIPPNKLVWGWKD